MASQGLDKNSLCGEGYKTAVLFLAVLFFFVSGAWGACWTEGIEGSYYNSCSYGNLQQLTSCNYSGTIQCASSTNLWCAGPVQLEISFNGSCGSRGFVASCGSCSGSSGSWYCSGSVLCSTQEEVCELNPDAEGCAPDSSSCDTYREQCKTLGGVFEGTPLEDGCSAVCNTCGSNASQKILDVKKRSCCVQGLAPAIDEMCTTPLQSGVGMTVSSNANLECRDPNLSPEAMQSYVENCNDPDSTLSSSSGEPSSSGDGGSSGTDTSGLGRDYYPILDTIRDSLVDIRKNVETITMCLLSPGACAGLMNEGDTVIVNTSDSTYIKQLGTKLDGINSTLDTSIQNSNERLQESVNLSISRANDSLIDSMRKYLNSIDSRGDIQDMDSANREYLSGLPGKNASAIGSALGYGDTASTTLRGDLEGIRNAIEGLVDTTGLGGYGSGYGDSLGRYRDSINKYYISDERFGELVDSTEVAWGVDSLDARWDSSYAYGLCNGDDCPPCSDDSCMGSLPANFVQRADSIARIAGDSLEASTKRQRDSLPTFWDSTFKELKQYSWFGSFDSTFLANIGAKIPNSNTCPEHCFAMDVNGTYAYVGYNMHLDWKLCRPIAPNVLNSLNAFDILKLLARILTVVTCLSILMWEVSSRRGGGIGL